MKTLIGREGMPSKFFWSMTAREMCGYLNKPVEFEQFDELVASIRLTLVKLPPQSQDQ